MLLVIFLVISRSDILQPCLIRQIPVHGFFYSFLKLQARLPSKFFIDLGSINRIAKVMSRTVSHIGDQLLGSSFHSPQLSVHYIAEQPHDVDVLPLIKTSDVVRLPYLSLMENFINGDSMVYHVEPIPHIFAFSVHRQRLIIFDVIDTKGDQLLWKLIGA